MQQVIIKYRLSLCPLICYPPPSTSNGDLPTALGAAAADGGLLKVMFPDDGPDKDGSADAGELATRLVGFCSCDTILFPIMVKGMETGGAVVGAFAVELPQQRDLVLLFYPLSHGPSNASSDGRHLELGWNGPT